MNEKRQYGALRKQAFESSFIQQVWQAVWVNRLLVGAILLCALVLAIIITLLTTPLFTSNARIQINRVETNIADVQGVEPESNLLRYEEFYSTQYALLESVALAERVSRALNLPSDDQFLTAFDVPDESAIVVGEPAAANAAVARLLLDNITISPVRGSSLIDVRFTSASPRLSQRIARLWVEEFIASSIERRFAATNDARDFLQGQLMQLRDRLEDSERQLVAYAQNSGIFAVAGSGIGSEGVANRETLIGTDLSAMSQALIAARADRIAAESALRAGVENERDPVVISLLSRKAELEAERANLLTQFEEGYPSIQAIDAQIGALQKEISAAGARKLNDLRGNYQSALGHERGLLTQVQNLKSGYLNEQRATIEYNILRREVDTNRELYEGLLQRYKEIGVAGVEASNVLLVDPPKIPDSRSSPNLALNLFLGLLTGGVIAGMVLFAKEQIDRSLRDPADVKDVLGLPLLGTVPRLAADELMDDLHDPKSEISEAYLSIGTMLDLSTPSGVPKKMMLTSAGPNEGKTSSSYAIARQLAKSGRRTVLLDFDLRNPSIADRLDLKRGTGVTNYLTGHATLAELIRRDIEPNLSIVTAGASPPNPGELISSENVRKLLEEMSREFDHVLLDAPPVLGLADAPLLASRVDGVVFVIEANRVRMRQLSAAVARLENVNGHIVGAIVTKLDSRNSEYGYGYGYGSGYGYGQRSNSPAES